MTALTWRAPVVFCLCLTWVHTSNSVLATSEVTILPPSVNVPVGSNITLDCAVPHNASVLWFHDNIPLETISHELFLQEVSFANEGIYKCCMMECTVSNTATAAVKIKVTILPPIISEAIGSNINLDCIVPQNASVLWYHDNILLETNSHQLHLQEVSVANGGIYKCCTMDCTVSNTATAAVAIGDPPRTPHNLTCQNREYFKINCSWEMTGTGDLNANVSLQIYDPLRDSVDWINIVCKKKNPSLQDTSQYCYFNPHDFQYMELNNIYRVLTTNVYAQITSEIRAYHKGYQAIPYPPDDVSVQAYSSTSISISWCSPPTWPDRLIANIIFHVEYKMDKEQKWDTLYTDMHISKKFIGEGETHCKTVKARNLKPYTLYCARVSSRKKNAYRFVLYSEPSEPACILTMEEEPGPPFDVKFEMLSSTSNDKNTRSTLITWQPVPMEERNGKITGYRIVLFGTLVNDHSNSTKMEYNVTSNITNLKVHGLDNYRTYTISVQAFNSAGMSWEKAGPDGPILALEEISVVPASPAVIFGVIIPITVICLSSLMYCIWHRGKKILKPTYDIKIPEQARNDNLYVTTVNFRLHESECFDELNAPSSGNHVVKHPPNRVCPYGQCPASDDYSEDPCTPTLSSSEHFPLLSGHIMDANHSSNESQETTKMLTVDCGEGKGLLYGHPHMDVGYNQTGSPLSVASGGSYWTTGGEENDSVSYHHTSPKGEAVSKSDEPWESALGCNSGTVCEPSSPDMVNHGRCYSMVEDNQSNAAVLRQTDVSEDSVELPQSHKSPTSPVALYSLHAATHDSPCRNRDEDSVSSVEDLHGEDDISSYVQQTIASSLGLLLPVTQVAQNVRDKNENSVDSPCHNDEFKNNERNSKPLIKKVDVKDNEQTHSVDSNECAAKSQFCTGSKPVPQSSLRRSPEVTGATPSSPSGTRIATLPKRSTSSGVLDRIPTYATASDILNDSDSMISMEDADLQYVQAGCLDGMTNMANSCEMSPTSSPKFTADPGDIEPAYTQNALQGAGLPGVHLDFPSNGNDTPNHSAHGPAFSTAQVGGDRKKYKDKALDNDHSDIDDESIEGYVTQGAFERCTPDNRTDIEACPLLPYVTLDLAKVPQKSTSTPAKNVPEQTKSPITNEEMPQSLCRNGYVPQNQVHLIGATKEDSPEKCSYNNQEYGILAQGLDRFAPNNSQPQSLSHAHVNGDSSGKLSSLRQETTPPIVTPNQDLQTNNNSPYVPHGKVPCQQNIQCPAMPIDEDSGYLPHVRTVKNEAPEKSKLEVNGVYVSNA